jgi:hypothetical protein
VLGRRVFGASLELGELVGGVSFPCAGAVVCSSGAVVFAEAAVAAVA